jgi:hypothetical protein
MTDDPIDLTPAPRKVPVGWGELPGDEPVPPTTPANTKKAERKKPAGPDPRPDLGGRRWVGAGPVPGGRVWDAVVILGLVASGVAGLALATRLGAKLPAAYRPIAWVAASGVFAVSLLGLAVRLRRGRWIEVAAFEHGLVYLVRGREATVRWADVTAVTERRVARLDDRGLPAGYEHVIRLACAGGAEHRLDVGAIADSDRLSESVHAGTLPHLVPRVVKVVTAGRRAAFGRLTLVPDGLVYGRQMLYWQDVGGIDIVNGVLVVRRRGDDDPWYAEDCGATPNLQVLLNLIRTRFLTPDEETARRNRAAEESRFSTLDKYMPAFGGRRIGY